MFKHKLFYTLYGESEFHGFKQWLGKRTDQTQTTHNL